MDLNMGGSRILLGGGATLQEGSANIQICQIFQKTAWKSRNFKNFKKFKHGVWRARHSDRCEKRFYNGCLWEDFFSRTLNWKFWQIFKKKFLIDSHYKNIFMLVRMTSSSYTVLRLVQTKQLHHRHCNKHYIDWQNGYATHSTYHSGVFPKWNRNSLNKSLKHELSSI